MLCATEALRAVQALQSKFIDLTLIAPEDAVNNFRGFALRRRGGPTSASLRLAKAVAVLGRRSVKGRLHITQGQDTLDEVLVASLEALAKTAAKRTAKVTDRRSSSSHVINHMISHLTRNLAGHLVSYIRLRICASLSTTFGKESDEADRWALRSLLGAQWVNRWAPCQRGARQL